MASPTAYFDFSQPEAHGMPRPVSILEKCYYCSGDCGLVSSADIISHNRRASSNRLACSQSVRDGAGPRGSASAACNSSGVSCRAVACGVPPHVDSGSKNAVWPQCRKIRPQSVSLTLLMSHTRYPPITKRSGTRWSSDIRPVIRFSMVLDRSGVRQGRVDDAN